MFPAYTGSTERRTVLIVWFTRQVVCAFVVQAHPGCRGKAVVNLLMQLVQESIVLCTVMVDFLYFLNNHQNL